MNVRQGRRCGDRQNTSGGRLLSTRKTFAAIKRIEYAVAARAETIATGLFGHLLSFLLVKLIG
jgi:hypothetical protein